MKTTDYSLDTKPKGLYDAFASLLGPYLIICIVNIMIIPFSTSSWLQGNLFFTNIFVTLILATISFILIYSLKKFIKQFSFDDSFIQFGVRLCHKFVKLTSQQINVKYHGIIKLFSMVMKL